MSGTREGGKKAAETNYQKHGRDFYREIGRKGGQSGRKDKMEESAEEDK